MKKTLIVLLMLALIAMLAVPVLGAEVTKEGLTVSLTTNQITYEQNDSITATLTLTNSGEESVRDLELELFIPEGYALDADDESIELLEPGQSRSFTLCYIPESNPETGDWTLLIVFGVMAAAVALLIVGGKPMAKRLLCVVLCGALGLSGFAPYTQAQTMEKRSVRVAETVQVDGMPVTLEAEVSYLPNDAYIDTDGDGIVDYLEQLLGADPENPDTDGDGLSDYMELMKTNTDPLLTDSDTNGTADGDEDADGDGLPNLRELSIGTDLSKTDTDSDGLSDSQELQGGTNPVLEDTDGDGVSDGREVELKTDPLTPEASFSVSQSAGIASVDMELTGAQVETLTIKPVDSQALFPESIPGYMGQAYDFKVEGDFNSADISFRFDPEQLAQDAEPVIYYFNEQKQTLEQLETRVADGVATATVEHFSTYILLDRTTYDGSFTWEDVWDSTGTYSTVEVVLVVDDSGSMGIWGDNNDPDNQRLTVARNMIDKLPDGCKIGVVWFATKTKLLTTELTADREEAKALLTEEYFTSTGSYTNMYTALNEAMTLFESTEPDALKTVITITDGRAHDEDLLEDTIAAAQQNNVRLYTVGLGGDLIITDCLEPLAEETGGAYYLAENADQLAAIYDEISKMIDLSADTDGDSIPDYYEDNLVAFNGIDLKLDKTKADTDGDGIADNQEVNIQLVYSQDRKQVYVKGSMISSPTLIDSDYDGINDGVDEYAYDNSFTGTLKTSYATSSIDCKMDYSWFFGDNSVYNMELSKLSLLFAAEIYAGHTLSLSGPNGTNTTNGTSITEAMGHFGLENAKSISLSTLYNDDHLSEVALGYHNVVCAGELKTVLAVTIRGTNATIEEWSSNCDIGDISTDTADDDWVNTLNHKGFDITATRIMREIEKYIDENNLHSGSLVYWVTGHSRGAAISNIVGANLEKAGKTAFTYTFAAPNCTLDPQAKTYTSIFNVINEDDFVPCLPMEYWGYTTYGRSTTTASIKDSYEKEWEQLTGIGDYNPDSSGMDDCVRDIGLILPEGSDPRVEAYRYTCACHGDGSNDTITIKNGGMSEDSREKAIAKIPACARPYCIITRYDGGWVGGWDFECCQLPAYLMQLLAAFMGGQIDAYRFAVELNIAKRYESAKGAIISAGISGIEHPHYTECYYVLASHAVDADFS
ncbi:MAG: VWA domain-containing protein [Ruminococcaceae bacterium]|nr:VWA domain-containing protein [Oscillospiraceae bacterium]